MELAGQFFSPFGIDWRSLIQPDSSVAGLGRKLQESSIQLSGDLVFLTWPRQVVVLAFVQCGGLRVVRLLGWKLVSKREKGKTANALKSRANKHQDPATQHITSSTFF